MKEKVGFHHFKGIGTLCVIETEGSEIGRFGLAIQHKDDKIFNRPLGRLISEGRARKGRGNHAGFKNLEDIRKVIAHLRAESPEVLGRQEPPKVRYDNPEIRKDKIAELKLDLLHSLVYDEGVS